MRRRSTVLLVAFIALEALAALALFALSVHGPEGLTIAAPIYLLVAGVLTWWVARRFDSVWIVSVVGVLALAVAPGVVLLLGQLERMAHERRIASTHVTDVRDEAILSSSGLPIGVRMTYTVSVPKRGYFAILPAIHSREARTERLRLDAVRWTIDGRSEPNPFEPGRDHAMVVELYPPIRAIARDGPCLVAVPVPPLPDTVTRAPLRVTISETTYGSVYRGGREQVTRGEYDLVELYRGVLGEGLRPCSGGQPTG